MKKIFHIIMLAGTLLSCTKETIYECSVEEKSLTEPTAISKSDALEYFTSFVDGFKPGLPSVTKAYGWTVESVHSDEIFFFSKSESIDLPKTLFYVVNFPNDGGFAVLAADSRVGYPVICITERGNLTTEDFSFAAQKLLFPTKSGSEMKNAGKEFMPMILLSSAINNIRNGAANEESLAVKTVTTYIDEPFTKTKWTQRGVVEGQYLFNAYTPNHAAAGCVAIATAQIMVANRFSDTMTFDGVTCTWDDLESVCNHSTPDSTGTDAAKAQAGHFVYELGKEDNCYIRYNDGCWGLADGAKRTLQNYGYASVTKNIGFGGTNKQKAIDFLLDGHPVYLDGARQNSTDGHAWVLDGLGVGYVQNIPQAPCAFFHINWGWHGAFDGYYITGYFDTDERDGVYPGYDDINNTTSPRNYTWDYRMLTYTIN